MKTKILQNVKLIIGLAFILLVYPAFSQVKSGKIRIGTYDSRIITMAYSRSAFFTDLFNKVGQEYKTAKESNDTVKMKKIEIQMKTTQHLLHQRVFGTGSISSIIDIVKDSISLIAKRENLNLHYMLIYSGGCKLAVLYLKCKTCGSAFSSGVAMDERSFQSTVFRENRHTCSKGHEHGYNKGDYFFKRASRFFMRND